MLWLPMQTVVAVAMPACKGRHSSQHLPAAAAPADRSAGEHRLHDPHAQHAGAAHASTDAHARSGHGDLAHADPADSHGVSSDGGSAATIHDCNGCGDCHLACAPLLGVRGFDFAATLSPVLIGHVRHLPMLPALDQPHPPPLA